MTEQERTTFFEEFAFREKDQVAAVAWRASNFALLMGGDLRDASRPVTREERIQALVRTFTIWPQLCRRMAELEQLAPASVEGGRHADEKVLAAIEAVASFGVHSQ